MPDDRTPEQRRKTMQAVGSKGTGPERKLWAMLAGMRLKGWRKNVSEMLGKPDVVFPTEQVVVFVDGCFWHGCPHCNRRVPETNREYWESKIKGNVERDRLNREKLMNDGWCVVRIWEHEIRKRSERERIRQSIRKALDQKSD